MNLTQEYSYTNDNDANDAPIGSRGTAELEIKVTKKDGTVKTYKVPATVEHIEGIELNG